MKENVKAVVSFSGGKDSMLSLYKVIKSGYDVIGLIVTFDEHNDSCFHKIPKDIFEKISQSLNIPLICVECSNDDNYEEKFEKALEYAKSKGADICVFGDIDIESHKQWGDNRTKSCNMKSLFPLWNENREKLVNEVIELGFRAVIKKVNLNNLPLDFLGKVLTKELIEEIKKSGSDACGENGEYHTIITDGPLFKNKIDFEITDKKCQCNYGYLNVK